MFRRFGDVFIPFREQQTRLLVELIPGGDGSFEVLELGCGAGELAVAILERWPGARVTGLDASEEMLAAAQRVTAPHGDRFRVLRGQLADAAGLWGDEVPRGIVSSLALHHLPDDGKRALFAWAAGVLAPGGRLLIADLVWPPERRARDLAAAQWDAAVVAAAGRAGLQDASRVFRDDGWNMYALPEPDPEDHPAPLHDQLDWLRDAGLVGVDVYWAFAGHAIFGGTAPSDSS